jgi:hypothetical protein
LAIKLRDVGASEGKLTLEIECRHPTLRGQRCDLRPLWKRSYWD